MELFGREPELARIADFIAAVRAGGGVRMVRGEPGVGKSALLAAGADMAAAAGMRVLRAAGSEFEADVSYATLNQLLLPLLNEIPRLPPGLRDALVVALGFGPGTPPAPLLACNAALTLLTTAAKKKPIVIEVDDVQWVDRSSAVVLGFIARRVGDSRMGVVVSSRTSTESFLDRRGLTEVVVQPLSPDASAQVVEARFPEMPPRLRQQLLDLAQGNPLALVELPATLSSLTGQDRDHSGVVPLSERLQTVFASRLSELPDNTRGLLLLITFEGSGNIRVLRGMTDLTDLAPAEKTGLVRVDETTGRIRFRHPLIQSAIVAMSTHEERRAAHVAIATAIPGDHERRAWHLAAATSDPDESVAMLLDEAAHRVMQRGDTLAAISALVRAAELSPATTDRARRLSQAAYIGAEAGGAGDTAALLAGARAAHPHSATTLHAANAAALLMINGDGDVHTAHRLLSGAIETGDHGWRADNPALSEAMHTMILLSWYAGTGDHWTALHRAVERLQPGPDDILSVMLKTFPDPVRTGAAGQAELESLLATLADEEDLTRVMRIGTASVYLDRLGDNREASWRLVRQGREGGAPRRHLGALMHLALDGYLTGRWDEAEETALEAQGVCKAGGLPFLNWYFLYNRAVIAAGRGRFDEAYKLADEITHWALPRGVAGASAIADHPRTLAAAGEGNFEAAYQHAAAMSPPGVLAPYVPVCTKVMFDLVEAALRTGRTAEAAAHADAMRAANVSALSSRMALLQCGVDALVLDDDATYRRLDAMLSDPSTQRWLFEASRIRLAVAEKLRRRKAFTLARNHLLKARTAFAAMRADPWLARTNQELRATGYRPLLSYDQPPTALTAQEHHIAQLAASGLTNKQIAERLYLSSRTVGAHLYRVFPKLGISSRAGLRDALSAHEVGGTTEGVVHGLAGR